MTTFVSIRESASEGGGEVSSVARRMDKVSLMVAGRFVDYPSVPQCLVCQCNTREHVESGLLRGHSYATIVRTLPEHSNLWQPPEESEEERATFEQVRLRIRRHSQRGHSTVEAAVARSVQEAFAVQAGIDLDGTRETIVTEVGVLNEVLRRGFEGMATGEIQPNVNQMMQAASMLLSLQESGGDSHALVFQNALSAIMRIISGFLTADQMTVVLQALEADESVVAAVQAMTQTLALEAGG